MKFDALTVIYGGIAAVGLGATIVASGGLSLSLPIILAATGLVASLIVSRVSRKLICDPYVGSVVAMEALASGDYNREIHRGLPAQRRARPGSGPRARHRRRRAGQRAGRPG
ncbi:hypothetical protein [Sphingomonas sanguinis]|uniref:hypothetical protein n=1 Tax=Sphingomonas sanguinis TaxID=33051 RepID=UPI00301AD2A3